MREKQNSKNVKAKNCKSKNCAGSTRKSDE